MAEENGASTEAGTGTAPVEGGKPIPAVTRDPGQDPNDQFEDTSSFDDLLGEGLESDSDDNAPVADAEAEEVPEEVVVEEQGQEPAGSDTQQTQEEPAPSAEAATTEPTGEQPSPQETLTPEQMQAAFDNQQKKFLEEVTAHYKLSDEEAEELESNPAEAMPKLAARLHMEVLQAAVLNTMRMLPTMMRNIQTAQQSTTQAETQFFAKWPALANHRAEVLRYAQAYRGANPTATLDQIIQDVGTMVSTKLGVQAAPAPAPKPKVVNQPPFKSAAGGRSVARPTEDNPFALMDAELFEEEI